VGIGVTVQPLVSWLWVGGAVVVVGAVLAALPGKRRRPTEAASAPPKLVGRDRRRLPSTATEEPASVAASPMPDEPAVPVGR
jgi:hypothetical protein